MNIDTFINSIREFRGLPSEMIDHACMLAPQLTNAERGGALAKLRKINDDLVRNAEEGKALQEQARTLGEEFHRNVLIPMRRDVETAQQKEDIDTADHLLADQ